MVLPADGASAARRIIKPACLDPLWTGWIFKLTYLLSRLLIWLLPPSKEGTAEVAARVALRANIAA